MTLAELGRRTGRPRDPACDAAILQATLELFTEGGYAAVSIEGVATRAKVGKASIYRRYDTKAQLVVDAIRCGMDMDEHLPDTGDLRADLLAIMRPLYERLRGPDAQLLTTFAAERVRHPDLAEEFARTVIGQKREHLRTLVQSAVDRGDLAADTDVDLAAEALPALIWHHAFYNLPMPDDLLERILAFALPT